MSKIQGSRVLITGGASGIGRRMALKMAGKGAHIILWDIHQGNLNKVAEEIRSVGGRVSTYVCNMADKTAIQKTAAAVKEETGGVDILINNAGVVSGQSFFDCSEEQIERTFQVNILAVMWTTRAFLPDMVVSDLGHVVFISSAAGLIGSAGLADYSASKFAVFGFDESLRMELKKRRSKVLTTVVCPFFINTGMFDGVKTRFSWLLPILDQDYVTKKIVQAIERNRRRLFMPRLVYTAAPLRILPVWMYDGIASLLGINNTMDEFKGRKG